MNHITRRIAWLGWLFAALLLVQTALTGLAAPSSISPLEGGLLQQSSGAFYVYHAGVKFPVQLADMGDQVLGAIPRATSSQWDTLFGGSPPKPERFSRRHGLVECSLAILDL
jgi:hypothetical protein